MNKGISHSLYTPTRHNYYPKLRPELAPLYKFLLPQITPTPLLANTIQPPLLHAPSLPDHQIQPQAAETQLEPPSPAGRRGAVAGLIGVVHSGAIGSVACC